MFALWDNYRVNLKPTSIKSKTHSSSTGDDDDDYGDYGDDDDDGDHDDDDDGDYDCEGLMQEECRWLSETTLPL